MCALSIPSCPSPCRWTAIGQFSPDGPPGEPAGPNALCGFPVAADVAAGDRCRLPRNPPRPRVRRSMAGAPAYAGSPVTGCGAPPLDPQRWTTGSCAVSPRPSAARRWAPSSGQALVVAARNGGCVLHRPAGCRGREKQAPGPPLHQRDDDGRRAAVVRGHFPRVPRAGGLGCAGERPCRVARPSRADCPNPGPPRGPFARQRLATRGRRIAPGRVGGMAPV